MYLTTLNKASDTLVGSSYTRKMLYKEAIQWVLEHHPYAELKTISNFSQVVLYLITGKANLSVEAQRICDENDLDALKTEHIQLEASKVNVWYSKDQIHPGHYTTAAAICKCERIFFNKCRRGPDCANCTLNMQS